MLRLSIIICTYNRSRLLEKCFDSLFPQLLDEIEIIVIDNNSQDDTNLVVSNYTLKHLNIRYVFEQEIGLSHARNRGIKESKAEWILFIDDDAMSFPDLVERALYLVGRRDFDCVGGMYYAYYEERKPDWIPESYGTKHLFSTSLVQCPYTIPCGGIVLYKKSMLDDLNGFSSNYGMKGEVRDIGEETELQYRAFKANYKIGFDPGLKVYHLVKPEYTTLAWFMKRAYLDGKTSTRITKGNEIFIIITRIFKSVLGLLIRRLPFNIYQLTTKKNYHWQNFIYDSFMPNFLFFGQLMGTLNQK